MRKFAASTVLIFLICYPIAAFAQEAPPETVGPASELLFMLLKIIFSVLGVVGTWLAIKGVKYFEKKTKIDIPAASEKALFDWADQAVGFAHEKSHQALKSTGRKLDGSEKLSLATGFVLDLVKKHNYDVIAETKLKDYVEAKLGTKRLEEPGVPPPSPQA